MDKATEFKIVYCNCFNDELAKQICRAVLNEQLAACCSIIPNVVSFFVWNGELVERNEFTIMIKTHNSKIDNLSKLISELHNDDVPEIISIDICDSATPYLNWLKSELL